MRRATGLILAAAAGVLTGCSLGGPVTPRTTTITITPTPINTGTVPTTSASTSTTSSPQDAPPTTYAEAQARLAKGQHAASPTPVFVTPSGNIYCDMGAGPLAGCELKVGRMKPPSADYCGTGGGAKDIGRIEFTPGGPRPTCNSDTIFRPGAPVLAYGSIARVERRPFTCLSESIGVTCLDTDRQKGFFIARDTYRTF